ncbi:sulfurtransferase [Occultella glacieicola]|uniref:Sulfurtransferase n=1 Tax=Occultella glacieicola TaxID=2518684 RepID=A0ABY2E1X9_9MICO|nr:sulfurtransferase [Occultella glacieicola]TDE92625.1 sulfurtransferase [Occultella glacieicola]
MTTTDHTRTTGAARLITPADLAGIAGRPGVVILDATSIIRQPDGDGYYSADTGRGLYEQGHLPGAVYVDLLDDFADRSNPDFWTALSPEQFAEKIGALGVSNDSTIVVYDQGQTMWATRLWWNLRYVGHDDILVLDGGLPAWQAAGRPVETGPGTALPLATFVADPRTELYASVETVTAALGDPGTALVNSLDRETFTGERVTYARPGRIPGSKHIFFGDLVDATGLAAGVETVRAAGDAAEVIGSDGPVIAYCGGGIAATFVAFQLARAGRSDVAVYDGSMTEWANNPALPLETGEPAS